VRGCPALRELDLVGWRLAEQTLLSAVGRLQFLRRLGVAAPIDSGDTLVEWQAVQARLGKAAAPRHLRLTWHRVVSSLPWSMIEMMQ